MKRFAGWSLTLTALLLPAGCATTRPPGQPAAEPAAPAAPPPRAKAELPTEQAAQVCLTAAREMEGNDHDAQAIAQYERARQYNPRLAGIAHHLALLYDRQGDSDRALAEYDRALQEQPKDADLLNDVGFFHYEHGSWAEAEQWLRKALALNTHHARAWVNLGKVLGQEGRYDESFAAFARVVKPGEAHCNVGVILAKQGKREEARQALHRALSLQPDLKQAKAILAVLEGPAGVGGSNQEAAARPVPGNLLMVTTKRAGFPSNP